MVSGTKSGQLQVRKRTSKRNGLRSEEKAKNLPSRWDDNDDDDDDDDDDADDADDGDVVEDPQDHTGSPLVGFNTKMI